MIAVLCALAGVRAAVVVVLARALIAGVRAVDVVVLNGLFTGEAAVDLLVDVETRPLVIPAVLVLPGVFAASEARF